VTRHSSSFDKCQRCSQEILSLEACSSLEEASKKLSTRTYLFSNLEEPSKKLKRTNLFSKSSQRESDLEGIVILQLITFRL
jgi:hypothetical protein